MTRAVFIAALLATALGAADLDALLERAAKEPGDFQLQQRIGVEYVQRQRLDEAANHFRAALQLKPDFLPARKNLATVLWFLGRKQESEREFRTFLRSAPQDPVPHLYLGLAANDRKQFIEAVEHFDKAGPLAADNPEVKPALAAAYLGAAREWDRRNLPQKAYAAYTRAAELDPGGEQSYIELSAFASAHGNNRFALGVLDRALERMPGSAALRLQHGIIAGLTGDLDKAEADFAGVLAAQPRSAVALLALGITQLQRGHTAESAESLRKAAALDPKDSRAHYLYALALSRDAAPDDARILPELRESIRLGPRDPKPRVLLAQRLLAQGQAEPAVSELEAALRAAPRDASALYQLGLAYRKLNRTAEADRVLRRFQEVKAQDREQANDLVMILRTE